MTTPMAIQITPRIEEAIDELKGLILARYPEATFEVAEGEDPVGIYVNAVVDVDEMGPVVDLFLDRLVDMQVDEELPIFVVPGRPPERNAAIWARQLAATPWARRAV